MTLEECEEVYMNGFVDEVSGDVDAPTGHFYRVGKAIVTTDNYGFHTIQEFSTVELAEEAFENLNNEYDDWCDEDE